MSLNRNDEWTPIIPYADGPVLACRHCRSELIGRPATEVECVQAVSDQHSRDMRTISGEFSTVVRELLDGDAVAGVDGDAVAGVEPPSPTQHHTISALVGKVPA